MQNFLSIRSAVLAKMTLGVAMFCYNRIFSDFEIVTSAPVTDMMSNGCTTCRVTVHVCCVNVTLEAKRSFR